MTDKIKLIKTIYIYLVSFVALMMIVISTSDLINQTLKTFIFTKADSYDIYAKPLGCETNTPRVAEGEKKMTAEECAKLEKANRERQIANQSAERQKDFAKDISLIIVGVPLFWFHWRITRRRK